MNIDLKLVNILFGENNMRLTILLTFLIQFNAYADRVIKDEQFLDKYLYNNLCMNIFSR